MNTTTVKVIGVVAAIALVVGVVAYNKTPKTIVGAAGSQGSQGARGEQGSQGIQGIPGTPGRDGARGAQGPAGPSGQTVYQSPTTVLGGVSSPDIQSPYFSFGGVRQWAAGIGFSTTTLGSSFATTTPCALQSPVSTSTLIFASFKLDISSTTASVVTMAKATTPYATTTVLSTSTVSANALLTLSAASTSIATAATQALGITDRIFAPSTYLVVGMQDNTPDALPSAFSPAGTCNAIWVQN